MAKTWSYNPTALHNLKKAITDRDCLAQLHQGLLEYIGMSDHLEANGREGPMEARFYSVPSGRTSPSDSLSYKSANSSLTSLLEDGKEEVRGGEGEAVPSRKSWRQSRHMGGRLGHGRTLDEHTLLYKDFSTTHTCQYTVLHIPMKQLASLQDSTPASQSGSPQLNVKTSGKVPPATRLGTQTSEGSHHTPKMMVMRLPLLERQTHGLLPVVTERAKRQKERGRRAVDSNTPSLGGDGSLAMASLCLSVCHSVHVAVSPLMLPVVERCVQWTGHLLALVCMEPNRGGALMGQVVGGACVGLECEEMGGALTSSGCN